MDHLRKFEHLFKQKKIYIYKALLFDVNLNQFNKVYNPLYVIFFWFRTFKFETGVKTIKKEKF